MVLISTFSSWLKAQLILRLGGVLPDAHRKALDEHNTTLRKEYGAICRETEHSLKLSHDVIDTLKDTVEKVSLLGYQWNAELTVIKRAVLRLTIGKPVMILLSPEDVLIKNDLVFIDGTLKPVAESLVGQIAGPFSLYVRKLV